MGLAQGALPRVLIEDIARQGNSVCVSQSTPFRGRTRPVKRSVLPDHLLVSLFSAMLSISLIEKTTQRADGVAQRPGGCRAKSTPSFVDHLATT